MFSALHLRLVARLMAYKCLSLCDFFVVQHFLKLCHIRLVLLEDFQWFPAFT